VAGPCTTAPPGSTRSRDPPATPHTFLTLEGLRRHRTYGPYTSRVKETAEDPKTQAPAQVPHHEQVPAPEGWTKTFTDPRLCAAIVDRLTFGGNIIETGTDSYRLAQTRARAEQHIAG